MFMCVKLNSLCDREMNLYYITYVLNQCINIKTMCPNYIHELRNTNSHLLQVYLGAWAKIETVKDRAICYECNLFRLGFVYELLLIF